MRVGKKPICSPEEIEHKTVTLIMRAADFLEILEDAAIKLIDAVIADVLHMDRRFLAANAARAKGNDRLTLQVFRQISCHCRKLPEMLYI